MENQIEEFNVIDQWEPEDGKLHKAFAEFMGIASDMKVPVVAYVNVAVEKSETGNIDFALSGGLCDRDEWIPPQFGAIFEFMSLDQEGQSFVIEAIKMARSNMAQNMANQIAADVNNAITMEEARANTNH